MKNAIYIISFLLFSFQNNSFGQSLIINELSQGTGGKEYVEFLVIGDTSCSSTIPCVDLRKVIFDDNNGWAGTEEVTSGAMRFSDSTFWSCIPQGTIIVVYNAADVNPKLPAIDTIMTDNNFRLIIPSSSRLFQNTKTSPTNFPIANPTYPADPLWLPGGDWSTVLMGDATDAFQLPQTTGVTPSFMISWGVSNLNPQIYFPGSAAGKVFSMVNSASSDFTNVANWSIGLVGTNETPGLPNSTKNDEYIRSISRNLGTMADLGNSFVKTNETCIDLCDGILTSNPSDGAGDYEYMWSNGETTQTISNLCPGEYTVVITDKYNCEYQDAATIFEGASPGSSDFSDPVTVTTTDGTQQYTTDQPGGKWYADCGSCIDATSGSFDPLVSGPGEFSVCYVIGTGDCADTTCKTQVIENCVGESEYEIKYICTGFSAEVFGNMVGTPGVYSQTYLNIGGCDSTVTIEVALRNDCQDETKNDFGYDIPNVFTPNGDGVNDRFILEPQNATINEAYIV